MSCLSRSQGALLSNWKDDVGWPVEAVNHLDVSVNIWVSSMIDPRTVGNIKKPACSSSPVKASWSTTARGRRLRRGKFARLVYWEADCALLNLWQRWLVISMNVGYLDETNVYRVLLVQDNQLWLSHDLCSDELACNLRCTHYATVLVLGREY